VFCNEVRRDHKAQIIKDISGLPCICCWTVSCCFIYSIESLSEGKIPTGVRGAGYSPMIPSIIEGRNPRVSNRRVFEEFRRILENSNRNSKTISEFEMRYKVYTNLVTA
jgi:hypothetical protein